MDSLRSIARVATKPLTILIGLGLLTGFVLGYQLLGPLLFG